MPDGDLIVKYESIGTLSDTLRKAVIAHIRAMPSDRLVDVALAIDLVTDDPPATVRSGASQVIADQILEESQWDVA